MKILDKVIDMCCTLPNGSSPAAGVDDTGADVVDSGKMAAVPETKIVAPVEGGISDKETKYESVLFAALPSDAKEAAIALGFDEASWNDSGWPTSESKWWTELAEEERKAAETLGWDKAAWDDKYESFNFADLPPHVAKAAESIGFTAEMLDGDKWPAFEHTYWKDLSDSEKAGLNVMGWTQWKWDHSP